MKSYFRIILVTIIALSFIASCGDDSTKPEKDSKDEFIIAGDDDNSLKQDDEKDDSQDLTEINDENPDVDESSYDSDGDTIPDNIEGELDFDNDGIPNYLDTDSDGDNIPDKIEAGPDGKRPYDADQDGDPDYLDLDSDDNGIADLVENGSDEEIRDTDKDGIPDFRDSDNDGDHISDIMELASGFQVDSDGDTIPDYMDTDSDNDSIPDAYEGLSDLDNDGLPNYLDSDSDNDGFPDSVEVGENPDTPADSDGDGTPDFVDIDSDNDGLTDEKEFQIKTDRTKKDTDDDGFSDNTELAAGSNPLVSDPEFWEGKFFVELPFMKDHKKDELDFSTNISKVDILIAMDVSGSMGGEINNVKEGINNVIIPGIASLWPDVAEAAGYGLMTFGDNNQRQQFVQAITTDPQVATTAVQNLAPPAGGYEAHSESMYQAVTGEGLAAPYDVYFTPMDCTNEEGSIGGVCFRSGALPIILMITDERFDDLKIVHSREDAIAAMNHMTYPDNPERITKAKFIGVDSSGSNRKYPANDYKAVSLGTNSIDGDGKPFNYVIEPTGLGLSTKIVDAVEELTENITMDITTSRQSIDNNFEIDTTEFIKAVKPLKVDGTLVTCPSESCDEESFMGVFPGSTVTFDIDFHNDIFDPKTTEDTVFKARINVLGEGAELSMREVWILVPGKNPVNNER